MNHRPEYLAVACISLSVALAGCEVFRPKLTTDATFCQAYEANNRRQKFDLRIGFDDDGTPSSLATAGFVIENKPEDNNKGIKVCRKDKIRFIGDRQFGVKFELSDNPLVADAVRRANRFMSTKLYHLPAKSISEGATYANYKFTICTPDCAEETVDKIWDPVIIVEK